MYWAYEKGMLHKRGSRSVRLNTSAKAERNLDPCFINEIEKINETIYGLNNSLARFKDISLRSDAKADAKDRVNRHLEDTEDSDPFVYVSKPATNRRNLSATIEREVMFTPISSECQERQRRNTASYGKSVLWFASKNCNNPCFIEKSKCHPILRKSGKPSKKPGYQGTFAESQHGKDHESRQVNQKSGKKLSREEERKVETSISALERPKLCKLRASKEYLMVEEEVLAIERDANRATEVARRARKLGTHALPRLEGLKSSKSGDRQPSGERRAGSKPSGNKERIQRKSTGRQSLRRELFERRMTIAQFDFQLQNQLEQNRKSRFRQRFSLDATVADKKVP